MQKNLDGILKKELLSFLIFKYLLITVLFIFVIVHAFSMDITNDEAYSFFLIKTNYFRAMPGSANTHWINSFFMKLFNILFGNRPGFMRLQSIVCFPFFALGIFKLSALINNKLTQLLCCCIILMNPYILDFFSLARGYGMALTFQTWLIIFVIDAIAVKHFEFRKWLSIILFSVLMVGANLSYFYSLTGVAGIFILLLLLPAYGEYSLINKQVRKIVWCFFLLMILSIADLLFIKYYGKDLGYGGNNFLHSLIGSVWQGSLYFSNYTTYLQPGFTNVSFALIVVAALYFTLSAIKKNNLIPGLIIAFPIVAVLILNILFHLFFKTPFLAGRTALQWMPFGIILIFVWFDTVFFKIKSLPFIPVALKLLLIVLFSLHFLRQANLNFCFEWRGQAGSEKCLRDLAAMHPSKPAINIAIGAVYSNYYSVVNKDFKNLSPAIFDERKTQSCMINEIKKIEQFDYFTTGDPATIICLKRSGISFELINYYPNTSTNLIKIIRR